MKEESDIAPEEDMEIIAKWNPIHYYIKFNSNGGSGTMTNQDFTYGVPQNLKVNTFTKSGCTFAGWAMSDDGEMEYEDGAKVVNLSTDHNAIINLYAIWRVDEQEIVYTATFIHNDGTGNTTTRTQSYGTALSAPTLTRSGYDFGGWNPEVPSTMPASNNTYTAQWVLQTINALNPVGLDMNSTSHSLTGYRGTTIDSTNPIPGWAYG